MKTRYIALALSAILAASCSSPLPEEHEGQGEDSSQWEGHEHGEGPWTGGAFDVREPPSPGMDEVQHAPAYAKTSPLVADNGDTNEVIMLLERDAAALRRAVGSVTPPAFALRTEEALVEAVRRLDPQTVEHFGQPNDASYLIDQQRPSEAYRQELVPDSPEDRLYRYVILRFQSIEQARRAAATIATQDGVEYASVAQALSFSAAPNDPYFPIKAVAAHYQWGLHAMGFQTAWDLTPGSAWLGAVDGGFIAHNDLQNLRAHLSFIAAQSNNNLQTHGMHVSGIMAATQNNSAGVAGACQSCSVVMATTHLSTAIPGAILGLVDRGVQAINMSFGFKDRTCASSGMGPICDAISYAQARDVLLVASAGNFNNSAPDLPANHPAVLAAGGVQNTSPAQPSQWQSWYYNAANGSTAAGMNGVVAPAKSIVSTTPASAAYNPDAWVMCGDAAGYDESGVLGDSYGSCTGTSMAAPHITALGGMIRSVNPRLSAETVKTIIRQNGSHAAMRTNQVGYGLPNAFSAVSQAVSMTPNRLTPLFSFYSAGRLDYFYTTVPQMASTALVGLLQPGVGASPPSYSSVGTGIINYPSFPGISPIAGRVPAAQVWIFTTPANPKSQSIPLAPLYRLSWKCGDPGNSPVCASNPNHTDFVYTADPAGVSTLSSWGYKLDGIEGYIYPKTIAQPPGTVRLMRKYNAARDDHAIFPEPLLASMQAEGYTTNSGSDWLGYVYPNVNGTVPSIQ